MKIVAILEKEFFPQEISCVLAPRKCHFKLKLPGF